MPPRRAENVAKVNHSPFVGHWTFSRLPFASERKPNDRK
jgi:hypothetical protein